MRRGGRAWLDFNLLPGAGLKFLVLHQQMSVFDLVRQAVQRPGPRPPDDLSVRIELAAGAGTLESPRAPVPPEPPPEMRANGGEDRDLVRRPAQRPNALPGRPFHVPVGDRH